MLEGDGAGSWVRPVGRSPSGELTFPERAVHGREPRLMELLRIPLAHSRAHGCHVEDYAVDPNEKWTSGGPVPVSTVIRMVDPAAALWPNGHHPNNDRIPCGVADRLSSSLRLIRVTNVKWVQQHSYGRMKHRLRFGYLGDAYDLSVTDPEAVSVFGGNQEGEWLMRGETLLCISLGEPFNGCRYKLVAGMIPLPRSTR